MYNARKTGGLTGTMAKVFYIYTKYKYKTRTKEISRHCLSLKSILAQKLRNKRTDNARVGKAPGTLSTK